MLVTDLTLPLSYSRQDLIAALTAALPLRADELQQVELLRAAPQITPVDATWRLSVAFSVAGGREEGLARMRRRVRPLPELSLTVPRASFSERPVIAGAGPAGLMAALLLAEAGARPILLERGAPVEERQRTVEAFLHGAEPDPECNVQFGEGGAGAFSDGKLKVGSMDAVKRYVLSAFVSVGAPPQILYTVGAHLGTDRLPGYVRALRQRLIALGGEVRFYTRVEDIQLRDDGAGRRLTGVVCYDRQRQERYTLPAATLLLATGHSAEDVFTMLAAHGIPMQARGFGIGMRIEHPRPYIDRLIYGSRPLADVLGAASYHLVTHLPGGRSVYSFCMCPGGSVVAATSQSGAVVTNGMSCYDRAAENSNAALLVSVTPQDFGSDSPLAGIALQRQIERRAFRLSGGGYQAPAISLSALLEGGAPCLSPTVTPSYARGIVPLAPSQYFPSFLPEALCAGLRDFEEWLPGYAYPDALLTAPETRSTSPVRILRGEDYQTPTLAGLYPVGEGAGYGGGIVSSAVDGVRCALSLLQRAAP